MKLRDVSVVIGKASEGETIASVWGRNMQLRQKFVVTGRNINVDTCETLKVRHLRVVMVRDDCVL